MTKPSDCSDGFYVDNEFLAERVGVIKIFYPFASDKISASDKDFIFIDFNNNSVTRLIIDNFGRAGEVDAVYTAACVEVVCAEMVVDMTVDIEQVVILTEEV